jgi:tetratricopeptide (TPR) repeat protein
MKKLIITIFVFMLLVLIIGQYGGAQQDEVDKLKMKEKLPEPWTRLTGFSPLELKFTRGSSDVKDDDKEEAFNQLFYGTPVQILLLNTNPIKNALEKVGVLEPVTLELFKSNDSRLAQLGTFTPHEKKGQPVFDIPKNLPVTFMKNDLKNVLLSRLKNDLSLESPEECVLIFKDASANVKAKVRVRCCFPLEYKLPQYETLDRFLIKGFYDEAEEYCAGQKEIIRKGCQRRLGDVYVEKGDFSKAVLYYEKIAYKKGFDKIGLIYLEKGDYPEAVKYFTRGTRSADRARAYTGLADYYRAQESNPALAKEYYTKAIDEYEYLIKDYNYVWNQTDSNQRRRCIGEMKLLPKSPEEYAREKRLQRLLEKASAYCERLYNNFFHFFCQEVITEYSSQPRFITLEPGRKKVLTTTFKYIYEYQLIRENKETVEWRTLLEMNGIKENIKNAQLMTRHQYEKLIFGPIAFLSKFWQHYYDYKILREDNLKGERVVIIEAIPKAAKQLNPLVGNIWVKEDENGGFDILKLEWNPKTIIENFEDILRREKSLNAKLSYTFFAEFDIKREGFRLPSRYLIEEAYIGENGKKKSVHARTEVIFKKHRYFSVSTEVIKSEGKIK